MRTETRTEWAIRLGQGGFVFVFQAGPWVYRTTPRHRGVFGAKIFLLSPAHLMPRCNKAPVHTNYRIPPPLCASLFRVGAWNDEITGPSKIDRGADALLAYPGTSYPGTSPTFVTSDTSTNCCQKRQQRKKKSQVTRVISNRFRLMNSPELLPAHERNLGGHPNDQDRLRNCVIFLHGYFLVGPRDSR